MFPKIEPFRVLVALLVAGLALAAPTGHDQQDRLQSVLGGIQIKIMGQLPPGTTFRPSIIDDVESALKANGALDAENIAALNQKIEVRRGPRCCGNLAVTGRVFFLETTYKLFADEELLQALEATKGIDTLTIAGEIVKHFWDKGAFRGEQDEIKDKMVYVATDMIEQILDGEVMQ